jgi:hypothetical protein
MELETTAAVTARGKSACGLTKKAVPRAWRVERWIFCDGCRRIHRADIVARNSHRPTLRDPSDIRDEQPSPHLP